MGSVRTPDFELSLGTNDFSSKDMKSLVKSIEVEQLSDGASSFKIMLDDAKDIFSTGSKKIREGDNCVIKMGFVETGVSQVIEGIVTGVKENRKEFGRKIYQISGFDGLQALTRGRKRRSWEKIKDSDIAGIIADECGLGRDIEDSGIIQPFVVQNNVTKLAFLYERARRIGFEVKVEKKNLVFKKPLKTNCGITIRWNAKEADGSTSLLQSCDFDTTTMNVVDKVVVRSYNPDTAQPIIASSSTVEGEGMGGKVATSIASIANPSTTVQYSDTPVYSEEEAEALAKSLLNQRADNFLTVRGSCQGNAAIKCGSTVNILDIGAEMEGEYYITSAKHSLKAGAGQGFGYWTSFTVSRSGRGN